MKFTLEELIRCPTKKKSQKRKKDEKKGAIVVDEASNSLEGIVEEIPRVPATKPEVGFPTGETEVAPPILMDIEMVEMTLAGASSALPIIVEEEV